MAYELDNEEENQNQDQETGGKTLGAESGVITGDQQKTTSTQNGTGNYTNLQSYIEQNKPANFGEQFANRVGETVTQAEQGQAEAENKFKQKADSSAVQQNEQLVNEAVNDPTNFVKDQNKLQAFRTQQNAQYGGPKRLSEEEELYSKAYNPTNRAQMETKTAQTGSGQKALLGQYYGAPAQRYNYSTGQKNLDQILIEMDPNSRQKLNEQQTRAKQAGTNFDLLNEALGTYAKGKETETNKAREGVESALGRTIPAWQQAVTGRVNQQLQGRDAQAQRINSALRNRQGETLTAEDRALLGIDLNSPLYNIGREADFNWVNPNLDANLQTLATPEEYEKSKAFATLANQPDTFLTGKSGTGALLTPSQDFGSLLRSKAQQWSDIQAGRGSSPEDFAYYNPLSADPWYTSDQASAPGAGRAYNIFNEPDLTQIIQNLAVSNPNDAGRRQAQLAEIEARKRALMDRYGALDYALQNSAALDANRQRITNARS